MQVPLVIGEVRHDRALHSHVLSDQHGECIPIREKAYGMTVSDRVSFQAWLWTQRPSVWPYEALSDSHKATKKIVPWKVRSWKFRNETVTLQQLTVIVSIWHDKWFQTGMFCIFVGLKGYIKNSWGISTEGCFLLLAPLPVLPMLFIVVNSPNLSD